MDDTPPRFSREAKIEVIASTLTKKIFFDSFLECKQEMKKEARN